MAEPFLQVHSTHPEYGMKHWILPQKQERAPQDPEVLPAGGEDGDRASLVQRPPRAAKTKLPTMPMAGRATSPSAAHGVVGRNR